MASEPFRRIAGGAEGIDDLAVRDLALDREERLVLAEDDRIRVADGRGHQPDDIGRGRRSDDLEPRDGHRPVLDALAVLRPEAEPGPVAPSGTSPTSRRDTRPPDSAYQSPPAAASRGPTTSMLNAPSATITAIKATFTRTLWPYVVVNRPAHEPISSQAENVPDTPMTTTLTRASVEKRPTTRPSSRAPWPHSVGRTVSRLASPPIHTAAPRKCSQSTTMPR